MKLNSIIVNFAIDLFVPKQMFHSETHDTDKCLILTQVEALFAKNF